MLSRVSPFRQFHGSSGEAGYVAVIHNAIAPTRRNPDPHRKSLAWLQRCWDKGLQVYGQCGLNRAGFAFTLLDSVDTHHNQARFTWGLGPADAPEGADPLVVGFDVAVVGSDGRLTTVLGFLDKVPA